MAVAALAEAVVLLNEEDGAMWGVDEEGAGGVEVRRLRERMMWEFSREGQHGDWWKGARGGEEGSEVELVYVDEMRGRE